MIVYRLVVGFIYVDVVQLADYRLCYKLYGGNKHNNYIKIGKIELLLLWQVVMQH
jgi:hypothetical protein